MNATILIGEKRYNLRPATLRQSKKMGELLGIDASTEDIAKIKWKEILRDDERLLKIIQQAISDPIKDEILDEMSIVDLQGLVIAFFLKGQTRTVKFENGLARFNDFIDAVEATSLLRLQPDTDSTSPSIDSPAETQKKPDGVGTT